MGNIQLTQQHQKPSKLAQFNLGFEFNETWVEARKKYAEAKK
jgi:hypothetical protein